MSDETESEPIPTAKQTIQAINCIRRFTFVKNDTFATEDVLRLTTILEQKVMQKKVSRAKQATITKYFRRNDS